MVGKKVDLVGRYFKEVKKYKLLTAEQEKKFAYLAKSGDKKAFNTMIRHNLRLVIRVALQFKTNRSLTLSDLISEGNLGLIRAIELFEPERGLRFSTYATWWVREKIDKAILNHDRTIRVPVNVLKSFNRYYYAQKRLEEALNREPTQKEIAEYLDVPVLEVQKSFNLAPDTFFFGDMIEGFEDTVMEDRLNSESVPEEFIKTIGYKKQIALYYNCLNEKQRLVLSMRYGLNGHDQHTLEYCAKILKVSRESIRQTLARAIYKIQKFIQQTAMERAA